ncbi:unnamed protein product [Didymodactylos carnosus]|uniref:BTB domain-containing protein n=1 Tax=Didymodactylos carnosus TaxID=1234261 RepID=A0A813RHC9_9BILA|nr:unnamed protein product [Didymodactylos carnosus]CAF3568087.1 unnamed protein product [Didymodactylos carnosus]
MGNSSKICSTNNKAGAPSVFMGQTTSSQSTFNTNKRSSSSDNDDRRETIQQKLIYPKSSKRILQNRSRTKNSSLAITTLPIDVNRIRHNSTVISIPEYIRELDKKIPNTNNNYCHISRLSNKHSTKLWSLLNPQTNIFCNNKDSSINPASECHAAYLVKVLSGLWKEGKMTDLVIIVGEKKYLAHKLALALFSPKFRQEFEQLEKCEQTKLGSSDIELKLSRSTPQAIEQILVYIYTSRIDLSPENVGCILTAAKELDIENIIHLAKEYLNHFSFGDVLRYMSDQGTWSI